MSLRELKALQTKKWKEYETLLIEVERRAAQKDLATQQKMIGKYYQQKEEETYYRVVSVNPKTADAHVFFFTLTVDDDRPLFECGFTTFYPNDQRHGLVKISADVWDTQLDKFYSLLNGVSQ